MTRLLAACLVLAGCGGAAPPPVAGPPAAPAAAAAPATVAPATVAAPAAPGFDAASLLGVWVARQSTTPFGPIPLGFDFRAQPDGSVRARTEAGPEQYIDLHFQRDARGAWMLTESAALPGVGVQTHTLAPARAAEAGVLEWRDVEKPELLAVRLSPRGEHAMIFEVVLRGEPHVRLELERVSGPVR